MARIDIQGQIATLQEMQRRISALDHAQCAVLAMDLAVRINYLIGAAQDRNAGFNDLEDQIEDSKKILRGHGLLSVK